ncbi:carboxylating nicotinate-nucleotide diphosphorylase [soil metagenome]
MTLDDSTHALITAALEEDVGPGDWTTLWTVDPEAIASGRIIARAEGVIAGIDLAREVFRRVDPDLVVETLTPDGRAVQPYDVVLSLKGRAASILTGERVALNFLQRLSGTATMTRRFVDAVRGTDSRILDTRKTTPGMRLLEKAAVRAGGGENHRFGLHDMILIKENHISAAGGITAAVAAIQKTNQQGMMVEVEATNLDEVREALDAGVDRILLDNMELDLLRQAVDLVRSSESEVETEASGGVSLESVGGIAACGVDYISVGALTHSAAALDLSLLIDR